MATAKIVLKKKGIRPSSATKIHSKPNQKTKTSILQPKVAEAIS